MYTWFDLGIYHYWYNIYYIYLFIYNCFCTFVYTWKFKDPSALEWEGSPSEIKDRWVPGIWYMSYFLWCMHIVYEYVFVCIVIYIYTHILACLPIHVHDHDYVHLCLCLFIYQMLDQPAKARFNLSGMKYLGVKSIHPIFLCWDVILRYFPNKMYI